MRARLVGLFCVWLGLACDPAFFAARHACRWHDLVDTASAGPGAWGSAHAWGLRSRWIAPAGAARQRRADACGPAALHAFLVGHRPLPTQDLLWSLCRSPRGGATLGRLAHIARRFGCGCEVTWTRALDELPAPAVVHLGRGHFVLLAGPGADARIACVLDPTCGWVRLPWAELGRRASGAVLVRRFSEVRS